MKHYKSMRPVHPGILMCIELLWKPNHIQCLYLFLDVNLS